VSPLDDAILFNAAGTGGRDLYRLNLSDLNVTRIAETTDYETAPSYSPDGLRIVYAAGVDHAVRVAAAMRAIGLKAAAVSGRTPPRELAETLAAYERGEVNVLVNAQLLAEGWNAPRATVCMHLAPTASRRVYQQRVATNGVG
jgi:superfamily II DNA/RNA helicase